MTARTEIGKLREKRAAAERNEAQKKVELKAAACTYAANRSEANVDALTAAAKRWTNAMHARSRAEKHLRDYRDRQRDGGAR